MAESGQDRSYFNFANQVQEKFNFLLELGFELSSSSYEPQSFGNAVLIMRGANFSLRFIRDRNQIFVDIGDNDVGWYQLDYILEFINGSTSKKYNEYRLIAVLAKLLEERWIKVEKLFIEKNNISEIKEFVKNKSDIFLKKIFDK